MKCPEPFRLKPRPKLQFPRHKLTGKRSGLSLLQAGRDPSYITPGAGATQIKADNGLSTAGSVNGQETQKKVYKDGFFEVGCYADSMVEFGDKFGNNADKYRSQHVDVSIVWYSEIVLKENQEPMKPEVCYQFCRTVPKMGYFGIVNGDGCYCTPYYKPMESGSSSCNVNCPGDTTLMCGGAKKSSVFEMHWCNDGAQQLKIMAKDTA